MHQLPEQSSSSRRDVQQEWIPNEYFYTITTTLHLNPHDAILSTCMHLGSCYILSSSNQSQTDKNRFAICPFAINCLVIQNTMPNDAVEPVNTQHLQKRTLCPIFKLTGIEHHQTESIQAHHDFYRWSSSLLMLKKFAQPSVEQQRTIALSCAHWAPSRLRDHFLTLT